MPNVPKPDNVPDVRALFPGDPQRGNYPMPPVVIRYGRQTVVYPSEQAEHESLYQCQRILGLWWGDRRVIGGKGIYDDFGQTGQRVNTGALQRGNTSGGGRSKR
jgi:hypothetical protein